MPKGKKRVIEDEDDEYEPHHEAKTPRGGDDGDDEIADAANDAFMVDDEAELVMHEHHGPLYGEGAKYVAGDYETFPISQFIHVVGAAENNLKNVDVVIPKYKLVVISGTSGSGKSSLVFETMCREAQREFFGM